jgi:NAD(P)H-hydrate epimerase
VRAQQSEAAVELNMASDLPPYVTASQMAEVDRAMIEDYGVSLTQMMESAGRNLAHLARDRFFDGDPRGKRVLLLVGTGGNGGGALVAARRLHNWGADVRIHLSADRAALSAVPRNQLDMLEAMSVRPGGPEELSDTLVADLIIDGIIGYSLTGAPRGGAAELIRWANRQNIPILSLDVPSGMDPNTGEKLEPAIRAAATMTLALPKSGLATETARDAVGELYLADIGVPPGLYARPPLNLRVGPLFARADVIRLG